MSQPAEKRATQVERLCGESQNMLTVRIDENPHHAVWLLLSKSAAHKLDYDGRVCPWNELKDAAERSESAVIHTRQSLLDRTMTSDALTQVTLLGPLSGTGLRLTSSCADAHFVARGECNGAPGPDGTGHESGIGHTSNTRLPLMRSAFAPPMRMECRNSSKRLDCGRKLDHKKEGSFLRLAGQELEQSAQREPTGARPG